jgi:protein-tyrosine phosphatase
VQLLIDLLRCHRLKLLKMTDHPFPPGPWAGMNRLLFLCTGNYYQSRFAEVLFNSLASGCQLEWRADSRGLALDLTGGNVGPMSAAAFKRLVAMGIDCASMQRFPKAVSAVDLHAAHLVVALDETEHRPLLRARFPEWENQAVYWLVHDLDKWTDETTLTVIDSQVRRLVQELRKNPVLGAGAKVR